MNRDLASMRIQAPNDNSFQHEILQLFPFTSESKRMGIIVRVRDMLAPVQAPTFPRLFWVKISGGGGGGRSRGTRSLLEARYHHFASDNVA